MRRGIIIMIPITCVLLVLFGLLQHRIFGVSLVANGRVVAVAKKSFYLPWKEGQLDVCAGNTNLFSLWEDFFDYPVFIYPFADGNRFLCIYDYDVSVLVFVVDFNPSAKNPTQCPPWPSDSYLRNCLAQGMTNVVLNTKGTVRLPTFSELQETSGYFTGPKINSVGVYSYHWPSEKLLSELATNRNSTWP